jgi:diguanylate cyclase (GGDEF)-like protein
VSAIENKSLALVSDTGPAGQVVRSLLPWIISVPLLLAGLNLIAERQSLFHGEVGILLFAAATVAVFAGLVWSTGQSLLKSDIERRNAELEVHHRAAHDRLTGLLNREVFLDRLDQRIKMAKQMPMPGFALLYIDLDDFKTVNDRLGHQAGDRLLVSAAELIAKSVREGDLASRMGGDEFTVLLEEISSSQEVEQIASRIIDAFSRNFCIQGRGIRMGMSIGAAIYANHHTLELIVEDADAALYQAKSLGKDRYAVAHSSTDTVWLNC